MKNYLKWLLAIVAVVVLTVVANELGATTLTGSLKNPDGSGANGTLIFQLAQQEALLSSGSCGGTAEVAPTYQVKITVAAGALVSPPSIYGNDCMLPAGSFYNITFLDTNGNIVFTDRWQLSGSTVDIGTIVSVVITGTTQSLGTPNIVYTIPTGNQTINQPGGTALSINNFVVTGSFTLPNGGTCSAGGCAGIFGNVVDITSTQTITGAKTFNSSILFSGGAGVGTAGFPANNGFFSGTIEGTTGYFSYLLFNSSFNTAYSIGLNLRFPNHLSVLNSSATEIASFDTALSPLNTFTVQGTGQFSANATTQVPLKVFAFAGQTANLLEVGAGSDIFNVTAAGGLVTNGTNAVSKSTTVGSCSLTWTNGLLTAYSGGC